MRIAEIFYSVQGEGKLSGVPSVFVRTSGCNLRCTWCDTPYASWHPEGRSLSIEQIVERVEQFQTRHLVITGGEPLIMPGIGRLVLELLGRGRHITVETAGTVYEPLPVQLMSISPKLSSSTPTQQQAGALAALHEQRRLNVPALQRFIDTAAEVQLKFVIDRPGELQEMDHLLTRLRNWRSEDILLMPQGNSDDAVSERSQWLIEACKDRGFRFCPRIQVMVWGARRGV